MPHADTHTMQEFLERFAATIAEDEHVVMMLDRAGWHASGDLRVPDNITPVPLPAYSPELNPVERVWLYLKERFLSHRLCTPTTMPSSTPPVRPGTGSRVRPDASPPYAPTPGSQRSILRSGGITRVKQPGDTRFPIRPQATTPHGVCNIGFLAGHN